MIRSLALMAAAGAGLAASLPPTTQVPTGRIAGYVPPAAVAGLQAQGNYKSWLCLLPTYTEAQCPEATVRATGIKFAHVAMEVPTDLTRAKAVELLQAMESLPQPVMVQCASGNRAGAVVALYEGHKHGWSSARVREWATSRGLRFLQSPQLLAWVTDSLAVDISSEAQATAPKEL